jgi:hypothetical protein
MQTHSDGRAKRVRSARAALSTRHKTSFVMRVCWSAACVQLCSDSLIIKSKNLQGFFLFIGTLLDAVLLRRSSRFRAVRFRTTSSRRSCSQRRSSARRLVLRRRQCASFRFAEQSLDRHRGCVLVVLSCMNSLTPPFPHRDTKCCKMQKSPYARLVMRVTREMSLHR